MCCKNRLCWAFKGQLHHITKDFFLLVYLKCNQSIRTVSVSIMTTTHDHGRGFACVTSSRCIDDVCGGSSVQTCFLPESGSREAAMASGLPCVVVLSALCVVLAPSVSALSRDCMAYDYTPYQKCFIGYCCGTCDRRYCCQDSAYRLTEDDQDDCPDNDHFKHTPVPMVLGIGGFITILLIFICCCVCPCCCLYKMCRKPRPVIATTTHTTVVTTAPQQYPQQPTATPGPPQTYQGGQYQPYHPVPVQPGYGPQPMQTSPYHGQPYVPGPPPTYQEATGPAYPPQPMPYSQAAYTPGQPAYPLHPPVHPQPNAPHTDFLAQPAYNPDFVAPPP